MIEFWKLVLNFEFKAENFVSIEVERLRLLKSTFRVSFRIASVIMEFHRSLNVESGLWELSVSDWVFLRIWDLMLVIVENLSFELTSANIQGSDARIKNLRILFDSMDDFSCRWGLGWFLRDREIYLVFLGIMFVSYEFHACQIKETSKSSFDGSSQFKTSSIIDLHIWFVFIQGSERILRVLWWFFFVGSCFWCCSPCSCGEPSLMHKSKISLLVGCA